MAIDLEFQRERTYWAKLCLIQLATRAEARIVDPLERDADIDPVVDLIVDPAVEVILHSGGQDLEILYRRTRKLPRNVFDTQIAAALLGMGEQIGYGAIVERLIGVKLDKLETLTDWTRRPLTPAQHAYALDDVRHLFGVRDALKARLAEKGRLEWAVEECAHYEQVDTYESDPHEAWLRISRTRTLEGRGLAVLRELAAWREETAQDEDEPRGRLAPDEILVEISRRLPKRPQELEAIRGLHPNVIGRHGAKIVEAVARGIAIPESQWPPLPAWRAEDPHDGIALDLLEVFLRLRALESEIAPSYLGGRRDLASLVEFARANGGASISEEAQPLLLRGWRRELVGDDLLAAIRGLASFRIDPAVGRVTVSRNSQPAGPKS